MAKLLLSDFENLDKLKQIAVELATRKETVNLQQSSLDAGQKALLLKPVLDMSLARDTEASQAKHVVAQTQLTQQQAESALALSLTQFNSLAELELQLQQTQSEQQQLAQLGPQLKELDSAQNALVLATNQREQAKQKELTLKRRLMRY